MGNSVTFRKINFEDMQKVINNKNYIVINTLDLSEQKCLIKGTIDSKHEEETINQKLNTCKNISIVIYGKNSNDETVYKKHTQLASLGFTNIFIYTGGIFEWLLLQDIYGDDNFPSTSKDLDILRYKSMQILNNNKITNY